MDAYERLFDGDKVDRMKRIRHLLEPIGLTLLLFAFGWQCLEDYSNQRIYEEYVYELNQKLDVIWTGIYDEALHSERYQGDRLVSTNFDVMNSLVKDWENIQKEMTNLNTQTSSFFLCRVFLYILCSICMILSFC